MEDEGLLEILEAEPKESCWGLDVHTLVHW